jgi:hypothetical protein
MKKNKKKPIQWAQPLVDYWKVSYWRVFTYVLALELLLAYIIPDNILTQFPMLGSLIDFVQQFAPVLGRFTAETVKQPEFVRCFIFVTLILIPIKVWVFYSWLNSNRDGVYRFLVVSILTDQQPAKGDNFVMDPARQYAKNLPKGKPRSMFSRVLWSTLILLITFGFCALLLIYLPPEHPDELEAYRALGQGGVRALFSWVINKALITSFLIAVSSCILRDYGLYFKRLFNQAELKE